MAVAVAGVAPARADRTMVGIGETMGDYLGAAHGGSGGRVVIGRTLGAGDAVRIGAEYDLCKSGDGLGQRFGADLRWTPTWRADPHAVAGPYLEIGVGRQVTGLGSRRDVELGLGLHAVTMIDGGHLLDQIFGVTVVVAPAWRGDRDARCAAGCAADRDELDVGVYFTAETAL
jgi:hypothetical protein